MTDPKIVTRENNIFFDIISIHLNLAYATIFASTVGGAVIISTLSRRIQRRLPHESLWYQIVEPGYLPDGGASRFPCNPE